MAYASPGDLLSGFRLPDAEWSARLESPSNFHHNGQHGGERFEDLISASWDVD